MLQENLFHAQAMVKKSKCAVEAEDINKLIILFAPSSATFVQTGKHVPINVEEQVFVETENASVSQE